MEHSTILKFYCCYFFSIRALKKLIFKLKKRKEKNSMGEGQLRPMEVAVAILGFIGSFFILVGAFFFLYNTYYGQAGFT